MVMLPGDTVFIFLDLLVMAALHQRDQVKRGHFDLVVESCGFCFIEQIGRGEDGVRSGQLCVTHSSISASPVLILGSLSPISQNHGEELARCVNGPGDDNGNGPDVYVSPAVPTSVD